MNIPSPSLAPNSPPGIPATVVESGRKVTSIAAPFPGKTNACCSMPPRKSQIISTGADVDDAISRQSALMAKALGSNWSAGQVEQLKCRTWWNSLLVHTQKLPSYYN